MRTLTIIGLLGTTLSIAATVYTAERYLSLSQEAKIIEALAPGDDVISPKIAALLHDQEIRASIQNELSTRWQRSALLHSALTNMNNNAIKYQINQLMLWISSSAIFGALLVALKFRRRKEVAKAA